MTLIVPGHLTAANIQDPLLRFEWDDWTKKPAPTDKAVLPRLERISQRAVLAFACGACEWIVHRFAPLCDDPAPWAFMEAAWAMMVDVRYCGYGSAVQWQDYAREEWTGPVKRPIKNALVRLESAFHLLAFEGHTDPSDYAAKTSALAKHVMTDPAPFARWSDQVLERFDVMYPRDPNDPLGDVVPREAVDPDRPFRPEETEMLVNAFIASLDYRTNRFLSPPEGMLETVDDEEAFQGIPYVFDITLDRQTRRRGAPADDE